MATCGNSQSPGEKFGSSLVASREPRRKEEVPWLRPSRGLYHGGGSAGSLTKKTREELLT